MSVVRLQTVMACNFCRQVGKLSSITKTKGLTEVTKTFGQLYLARQKSVLTRIAYPTASFTSSTIIPTATFRQRTLTLPNQTFAGLLPFNGHLPCPVPQLGGELVRAYSISPQPQQKDDAPGSTGSSPKNTNSPDAPSGDKSSSTSPVSGDLEEEDAPKGIVARFKDAYKNYGKVLIGVHLATSAVWFGSFYYAAYLGIDVVPMLKWIGLSDRFITPFESSGIGNVAVAYLLYKIATPARYTVTIVGTRYTVRQLRRLGYMEPIPEGARLRDFVKESREQVREKYEDLKDEVKERKDEYKEKYDEKLDSYKGKIEEKRTELREKLKKP